MNLRQETNFGILTFRPKIEEYPTLRDQLLEFIGSSECNWFEKFLICEERTEVDGKWNHLHIAFLLEEDMPKTHTGVKRKILERDSSRLPKCENMSVAYDLTFGNKKSSFYNSCAYCIKGIEKDTGRKICEFGIDDSDWIKIKDEFNKWESKKTEEELFVDTPISRYIPQLYKEYLRDPLEQSVSDINQDINSDDYLTNLFGYYSGYYYEEKVDRARHRLMCRGIYNVRQKNEYIYNALKCFILSKSGVNSVMSERRA